MSRIENLSARLVPFDLSTIPNGPMTPIKESGGLVFQYSPDIAESIQVNYEKSADIIHSNESYHVFKNAENRRITLSNIIFTADTDENARYMLAAIHFFRTYQLMDYGKNGTGRPPAPMWFDAYGRHAYGKVPVLLNSVDITFQPSQHDMVPVSLSQGTRVTSSTVNDLGVPRNILPPGIVPGSGNQIISNINSIAAQNGSSSNTTVPSDVTWVPAKLEVGSIQLTVQHSPSYWKNDFSLSAFKRGDLSKTMERGSSRPTTNISREIPVPRPNPRRKPAEAPTSAVPDNPFRV